jgi:hypothetical protein
LPGANSPLAWFSGAPEDRSGNPLGNLLARFLPLRPCVLRGTLGYSGTSRSGRFYLPDLPLLLFDATTASLAPARCALRRLLPTTNRRNTHLARAMWPFSVSGTHAPSFHLSFGEASKKLCPAPPMCRPQGLATLPTVSGRPFLGNLFQLPTLLGFDPSELFSSPADRERLSPSRRRSCAFFRNLPASDRRFSGCIPREKPLSPPPDGLDRGERVALLGFRASQALSPV